MNRSTALAAALFLTAPALTVRAQDPAAAPATPEAGFVSLFNGTDLSGWVNVNCAPETWTVRDGMIHCDGTPTGALRTVRTYENFVLELEWRHLTAGGNAGVFIWASPLPAPGQPFLRAIEVQVLDHAYGKSDWFTTDGDVFAIHGATMKPFPPSRGMRSFPTEKRSKGSPEWNHYRITCQDGTIRLAVNGKDVSGGEACVWRCGYIGLESEGAPVDWRNLRIRELPSTHPAPDQCAPPAPDSTLLYDGRTLRGWKAADGAWQPSDWQLLCRKTDSPLTLERPFTTGTIQFDVKAPDKSEGPALSLQMGPATLRCTPAAGWKRMTLTRDGDHLRLESADGSLKSEATVPAGTGTLTISATEGTSLGSVFHLPPAKR